MLGNLSIFQPPADSNALIWRYLDFTKFVDLLDTKTLFFTRADHFNDRFEGSYPRKNVVSRSEVWMQKGFTEDNAKGTAALMTHLSTNIRRYIAINCWHMNPHESAAMWRLYLKSNEGIAIQSNYSCLAQQLHPLNETVHVGAVKYIDYDTEQIPAGGIFDPFIYKRKSFEHEKEIRAVIHRPAPTRPDHSVNFSIDVISDGIRVPVNLEKLILGIFVAPESPAWFTDLVKSVARKYSVDAPVVQSSLANDPVF